MLNPMSLFLEQTRHAVIDPTAPSAAAAAGPTGLLIPIAIIVVTTVLGFWLFNREAPHIAEQI
jgi:ABC-2 type transport system permease protein